METNRKLQRNPMNKVVGGVCSGLADYFNIDVALVRVLFVVALLFASFGFWLYIALWIVMPEKKVDFNFQDTANSEVREERAWENPEQEPDSKNKHLLIGVLIVLVGILVLINNFTPISWVWKLWPLILVAFGIVMIYNSLKDNRNE